jgi:hypothetical protein
VDVINSLYLTNNKASSYLYVQGDAGYDKYTYVNQRHAFSRPVPSRPGFFSGFFRAVKRPQKLNLELSFETQSSHQSFSAVNMKLFEL